MAPLAFTTPYTGAPLRARASRAYNTPRCEMGDSVAPKISFVDTKSDATSKINISWDVIPPNTADAITVEANTALAISLRSTRNYTPALPSTPVPCPPDTAPADFYFPKDTRNLAPVIDIAYNESVSVSYDKINPTVGGVAADSVDSVAFWKAPTYKYAAPDDAGPTAQETISTAKFEKYFPSNVRNFAPMIKMQPPKGDWDISAFVQVASEFVVLNEDIARELSVSEGVGEPSLSAAATVEKYFGDDMNKAPDIFIDISPPQVKFGMAEVEVSEAEGEAVLASAGAQ